MYVITDHNEFRKYAVNHRGISSNTFDQYAGDITNMTRSVIEERDMPFREVDVFSRLIADRIIFVGTELSNEIANIIQAQLLFLESTDPTKDIQAACATAAAASAARNPMHAIRLIVAYLASAADLMSALRYPLAKSRPSVK